MGSGRPFSRYGPGVGTYADSPVRQVGIRLPQPVVADRIAARYRQQMADGFLAEVEHLAAGPPLSRTAAQALGYRELLAHVAGRERRRVEDALDEAVRRTRVFARRQRAWFRRDPRITWLDAELDPGTRPPTCSPPPPTSGTDHARNGSRRIGVGNRGAGCETGGLMTFRLTKHHGLGNDFLVHLTDDAGARATATRDRPRRAGATATTASARTGCSSACTAPVGPI